MTETVSLMRRETREIPEAVERLLSDASGAVERVAEAVRDRDPAFAVTVARGSSDHACTYLKYVSELLLGVPVASVGPSIASIYDARLRLDAAICVSVSQSGRSPDIVGMTEAARRDGAMTLAITNDPGSPLADVSDHVLDICAGPERSVAATKTFVTSAVAGSLLLAHWSGDRDLLEAIRGLPGRLSRAVSIDWPDVREAIDPSGSFFVLGRGPGLAIANEAALKFKETCQVHAESYSTAEVLHGPVSIVSEGFPIVCLAAADAAEQAIVEVADSLAEKGARAFVTSDRPHRASEIECVRSGHPLTDAIPLIVSFYAMVERYAQSHGIDPDVPRHLQKVTETR